jgi:hypothetical protein
MVNCCYVVGGYRQSITTDSKLMLLPMDEKLQGVFQMTELAPFSMEKPVSSVLSELSRSLEKISNTMLTHACYSDTERLVLIERFRILWEAKLSAESDCLGGAAGDGGHPRRRLGDDVSGARLDMANKALARFSKEHPLITRMMVNAYELQKPNF